MSTVSPSSAHDPQVHQGHAGKAIVLAIAAAVGGFLFGFDSSVINGAVDAIQGQFHLSAAVNGVIVALALLGSAVGAWFAGDWADRWGRTRVMFIGGILFFISSLGSAFAFAAWDLGFWRIVGGIGIGIASVIAPAYIAEISPAHMRGRLGSLQQLAITFGIFVALLSDAFIANSSGGASNQSWLGWEAWRWMFVVGIIPSAIYGVLALTIPESPRFLVAKGKKELATKVLSEVLGKKDVSSQIAEIERTVVSESAQKQTAFAAIRDPKYLFIPIVWVGILLSVFQQFVGINVIFYYSTSLWQSVGFDESDSFGISVFTGAVNILVTLVAIALVDRIGRRLLLLIGSVGMTVSLGAMTLAFTQANIGTGGEVTLSGAWGPVALVAANLFVVAFGATWGPVVWVLLGEMFPNKIRAAALSIAAAAQWIANFVITVTFPPLSQGLSLWFAYGLYTLFALLSFFFVLSKVKETKGIELEKMSADVLDRKAGQAG